MDKLHMDNIEICDGLSVSSELYERKENRLLTLLAKGTIVYLLTMGSIGFYLSSFKIEYNEVLCNVIIFAFAIMCAMLYYRLLVENIGYLIFFITFAGLVYLFRTYINSGFYAIVNITVEKASGYFGVDVQRLYNEQIENRYLTVTCVVLFIGIVLDIFLNVYISRRMQYLTAFFVVMSLNVIPLYMTEEPDMRYSVMLLAGMAMAYVLRSGKHYSPQVSVKRYDYVFDVKRRLKRKKNGRDKKLKLGYVYDVRAVLQAMLIGLVFVIAAVSAVRIIKPVEKFNVGYKTNKYKEVTMAAMSTLMLDGISGFYRNKNYVGGLDSGKLGAVSSVRLDHQTDLVVEFTPYSYDTLYLRSFVGGIYNPYENTWTNIENVRDYDSDSNYEALSMKAYYENGGTNSAKGEMRVKTVDSSAGRQQLPYYTGEVNDTDDGYKAITYYPYLPGNEAVFYDESYPIENYLETDLEVPEENREAIEEFVNALGIPGTDEQFIQSVIDYYQENIPYTIKPGKTPKKEDFINYFLQDNKKGYCAHFASAAVLAFRYMGIPARYVEGYAVSYNHITDGEIVEDESYSDYYDGYSAIGETALVQVEVTDADAHAWVEVYSIDRGWYVVDVTPSSGQEEEAEDFWDMFDRIMDTDADSDEADEGGANLAAGLAAGDKILKGIGYFILGAIGLSGVIAAILGTRRFVLYLVRFKHADINDRLIMRYSEYRKKLLRRDRQFVLCHNYSEQLDYIAKNLNEGKTKWDSLLLSPEELSLILERAGFSGRLIEKQEYDKAITTIKTLSQRKYIKGATNGTKHKT